MQLYLIPPECGQGERASKRRYRRCPSLSLTPAETRSLRAAIRGLHVRFGSWRALSAAMDGVHERTLCGVAGGVNRGSPALLLLAARVGRTTVERILGGLTAADRCPSCGRGAP